MAENDTAENNTASPPDAPSAELAACRQKLAETEQQLNNFKLYVADFENAKKRTARDAEVAKKYAAEPLGRDLLAAMDNLDRALAAARQAGDDGPLVSGVSATASMFLDVLKRHGITRIDCGPGTAFDPHLHEAVMQQPGVDIEPGHVLQVLQQGFLIHDRVLRPTTVIVAS